MKEPGRQLLEKASRSLQAAERLLQSGDAEFAVGRAYYTMFYAAEALLSEQDLRFRKHGGVHAAFGEHFAKTGIFDPKYHRWLLEAFNKRVTGDYGIESLITAEDAATVITQAREFLETARRHLESHR
jgi:uncharacterized protein (UPF0332 family)